MSRASPAALSPSCSAWPAADRSGSVNADVPRERSPSRCPTAPASIAGISRRIANGTNVAMTSSAPPASTAEKPPLFGAPDAPDETAPAARLSVATITNFERINAASVSTSRRHQCDTAGHTSVASASGRNSTAT